MTGTLADIPLVIVCPIVALLSHKPHAAAAAAAYGVVLLLLSCCCCLLPQGRPASDLSNLDGMDGEVLQGILSERKFLPYTLKLKIFQDTYQDEARTKVCVCVRASQRYAFFVAPRLYGTAGPFLLHMYSSAWHVGHVCACLRHNKD